MNWWQKFVNKLRRDAAPGSQPGCDHGDAIHLRQGTPEFEEFVARGELELHRDLKHGASHLANLIAYDPARAEWVDLLEAYLAAGAPDPEALIPRGDKLYYSTEALRAYLWHSQGRRIEAIQLLIDLTRAKPDACYLEAWALDWLEPPGAIEALPDQIGAHLLVTALNRFREARVADRTHLRQVGRWAALARRFCAGRDPSGPLVMTRVGLARKAGLFDEAIAVARDAFRRTPNWHTAGALGLALREQGDWRAAEEAFQQALDLEPKDVSIRLEAGDMLFRLGDWQHALDWYENALAHAPEQPWALPSAEFCRWKLTGDETYLDRVIALAKEGNSRADGLWHQAAWSQLNEPADATANMIRQIREAILEDRETAPKGEVRLTLSSYEVPSNFLAFRLEMEALRHEIRLLTAFQRIPQPDPREPIEAVQFPLWTFDGIDGVPALPPPSDDVTRHIADLASAPFDDDAQWAAASAVAEQLGPTRVGEILATMVHPPPVPSGGHALAWLPRVQHAAAQVAAQVDEGWQGSARREALLSVLLGPQDWTTVAAIRALARIGSQHEALAHDIHQAFERLAAQRPDGGYCSWEIPLYQHWLQLPLLFPHEREAFQKKLRELAEEGP
jgi:tetratricopeptide (TPR) repeat protein